MSRRNLRAVEQGDPGHVGARKLARRVTAPRSMPAEPDWREAYGLPEAVALTAHTEWARVGRQLHTMGLLSGDLDATALADYAICCARIVEAEGQVSEGGLLVSGKYGPVRNPCLIALAQYRTQLARLIVQLGLSPNARAGLHKPDDGPADDDPFDT